MEEDENEYGKLARGMNPFSIKNGKTNKIKAGDTNMSY